MLVLVLLIYGYNQLCSYCISDSSDLDNQQSDTNIENKRLCTTLDNSSNQENSFALNDESDDDVVLNENVGWNHTSIFGSKRAQSYTISIFKV